MKKLLKYLISMGLVIGIVTPFTIKNINAASMYQAPINEPQTDTNSGYIAILLKHSSGVKSIQVYQWVSSDIASIDITLNNTNFTFHLNGGYGVTRMSILQWFDTSGVTVYNLNTASNTSSGVSKNFPYSGYTIVGYLVNGNVEHIYDYLSTKETFGINWNEGDKSSSQIANILNNIIKSNEYLLDISGDTNEIMNYLKTISDDIKTNNSLLGGIIEKLNELINAVLQNDKNDEVKEEIENSNNDLENVSNEYNEIESNLIDSFKENIQNINLQNNLFNGNDFIKTSNFIATQMTNIYDSNDTIKNLITYSLIIGLALTVIGIGLRR